MNEIKQKADYLFEVSWEVCNKVGGISTVIKSKAAHLIKYYGEKYFTIGPYFIKKVTGEFQEEIPTDELKSVFDKLKEKGIICHYGKWLIGGEPNTILIDFTGYVNSINDVKKELWDKYKIDSIGSEYYEFDEPMIWSHAAGMLIDELSKVFKGKCVGHFHEWLAGPGLLYLKNSNVGTVFTTHATVLGRTIASDENIDLYSNLDKINPDDEAYKYKVHTKYQTEKAAAQNADVFTTVSEITAIEAGSLLKRNPDVLLPNGLNLDKFPTMEDISIKHQKYKNKIKEFLLYYFFPYQVFEIDNTYIFFIAGRYEFHDKGIDVLIKALGKLNEKLKQEKINKTVVAFFWIPGNIRGIKSELLSNRRHFNDVRDTIDDSLPDIRNELIHAIVSNQKIDEKKLLDQDILEDVKRKIMRLKKEGKPSLATHDLYEENSDAILNAFKQHNLNNEESDKVKVIFYSIYLTGADGLLDTSYYESMLGSQLGIFPSYYEPWGYTPLEAGALGVASVTTDLAGFGRFISKKIKKDDLPGIYVLNRLNKSEDETAEDLNKIMYDYVHFTKDQRVRNKIKAKKIASLADWKNFVQFYIKAHNKAVDKKWS
ncbi:glycogen/starch synthase [Candidatus Woesearchaeota archaeon]|nr:glycogen/starch synthase [Candidatus Woesearchaeota archaeon]